MLDKMLLGRYINMDSWIHRLDPRTKLLASFYFIFVVFLADSWLGYAILALFTLLAIKLTGLSFKFFINGVKPMIWLILFTVVFQILFTNGGHVFWQWGPFVLSTGQKRLANKAKVSTSKAQRTCLSAGL